MVGRKVRWLSAGAAVVALLGGLTAGAAGAAARAHHVAPAVKKASGEVKIGVDLTYDNTDFWSAYDSYEKQYASQLHIDVLGPLLSAASASLQNSQIETLVNEGAQAIVVNPETATSLGPAIAYAAKHHVKLISVDTIVGVGKVYMVVRASNLLYGYDACAYISSKVRSGVVLDLEGDLTSSNGQDRTNAFNQCMKLNDPGVKVVGDPTVWTDSTAVTDFQDALSQYGSQLKAVYSQWSSPDLNIVPTLKSKGYGVVGSSKHIILVSDDGIPFEMCNIANGSMDASQSQPANLYAYWALSYAKDAAQGIALKAGMKTNHGTVLSMLNYKGDANLGDPIIAPFVTKTAETLHLKHAIDGFPSTVVTTPVSDAALWGNVYGKAHGGVCTAS